MSELRYQDHGNTAEELPADMDTSNLLRLTPNRRTKHEFTYTHPAGSWDHIPGVGWVPSLAKIQHYPGLNGIKRMANGKANPSRALAVYEDRGDLVLRRNRFKVDGKDYVVRHKCMDGGFHYTNRFVSFKTIGGRVRTIVDREGWQAWLLGLIADGHIDQMPYEVLEDKLKVLQASIRRFQTDPRIGSAWVQNNLEELAGQRKAMVSDWERAFGDPAKA